MRDPGARSAAIALLLVALAEAGCSASSSSKAEKPFTNISRIAILRLERGEATLDPALAGRDPNPAPQMRSDAETAVTAQLYGVLANDPRWRLVPDLDVDDAMRTVPLSGSLESRALALGKDAGADAVLCGRVSRFQDRSGSDYGTRFPASVAFQLELVQVATGEVVWSGAFDQTQQDLTSNLLDFWMFWREGPRWFTAAQLAGLGAQKLVAEMDEAVER